MVEGNPWVAGRWRRLADREGAAKDAEVDRIEAEQSQTVRVARAARELQRLQPDQVRSWASARPFPARTTYIPMIGEDLARIRGLGNREWMALQDRVLLVVHPEQDLDDDNGWLYGLARLYSASPATPPPDPAIALERQGWTELEEGTFSCPGCSISRCTSCVSARVVHRSACRGLAAKAGSRLVGSNGVAGRMPTLGRARPLLAACSGRRSSGCAGPVLLALACVVVIIRHLVRCA